MKDHAVVVEETRGQPRLEFAPVFNAAAALLHPERLAGQWDKVYLRTNEGHTLTYGMLAENANRCGNLFLELGLVPGDRAILVVRDSPEFPALFLGAIKAGIVPIPLNTLLRAADFQFFIEDSQAAAVIYSPEYGLEVEPAICAASHRPGTVMATEGGAESLLDLLPGISDRLDAVPAAPDDDCFWLYSSGSTGRPKGAVHKQRSLVHVAQRVGMDGLGVCSDDLAFSTSKMFFAYGLGNLVSVPLWSGGAALATAARPTAEIVFDMIERFRPTLFYSVPTLYAMLIKALEEERRDLSSLRACYSSGESLPPHLFRRWRKITDLPILEVMGTTETCYCVIGSTPQAHKPGYSGVLMPGIQARIEDDNGRAVPSGKPGHLLVQSRAAAKFYWNNPQKTAQTMLQDGWLRTGDTYSRDEDGFFRCLGRDDDMLKISGIWCSPLEIEAKLIEHPQVLESAVVGRLNEFDLIKPEAWIVLKDPSDAGPALSDALVALCKQHLAPYKYPHWFNYVEELPKTATGKIQRVKLRARHGDLVSGGPIANSAAQNAVLRQTRKETRPSGVGRNK